MLNVLDQKLVTIQHFQPFQHCDNSSIESERSVHSRRSHNLSIAGYSSKTFKLYQRILQICYSEIDRRIYPMSPVLNYPPAFMG
ncbi:unnamed protein product [Rhizophagus irregularis]|nr:unnamed protein product [Rhizophagus irregularis]